MLEGLQDNGGAPSNCGGRREGRKHSALSVTQDTVRLPKATAEDGQAAWPWEHTPDSGTVTQSHLCACPSSPETAALPQDLSYSVPACDEAQGLTAHWAKP